MGVVRRVLGVFSVAAVSTVALVGVASAPVAADASGYTIQVQLPNGPVGPSCRLAGVDLTTGALTPIGSYLPSASYACAVDLAFGPDGALYGVAEDFVFEDEAADAEAGEESSGWPVAGIAANGGVHLVRFDIATGAVTDLGAIGTAPSTLAPEVFLPGGGLTFDAAGNLWVYMVGDDAGCQGNAFCLYQVDPANPATAVFKGGDPAETYLFGLTARCAGGVYTLEQTDQGSGSQEDVGVQISGSYLDTVDTAIGKATRVGPSFGDDRFVQAIDFGADGTLHGIGTVLPRGFSSTGYVFTLDPATGAATSGPRLDAADEFTFAQGLAVAPLSCAPPPAPQPAAVTPAFTG